MADGPVFWHQGLFLQPQHFQCTDQRTERLLAGLAGICRPWLWGVQSLQWDMGALKTGTVHPLSLQVVFPGTGIELRCPGNAVCAGRVPPDDLAVGDSMDVYLGMACLREGEVNVTVAEDADELARASTRLALLTGQPDVADCYQEGPSAAVRHLRYVLQLVFASEREQARDMQLLRIARLCRTADGLTVDADYAPPCLRLGDSPLLLACFREVRDRVLAKTRELDSYKKLARRGNMGEMTTLFLILRSLARFAARLQLQTDMPVSPPWEAYLTLRELLAELSVFSARFNPLGEDSEGQSHLVPYAHDDPAPAFRSLRDAIALLLDGLSTGPRYLIRFEPGPVFLEARLPAHIFDDPAGRNEYWISLHSDSADLAAHTDSVRRAKFSPTGEMATLLTRALPGLPFSVETQPPMGLARKAGAVYLQLHTESPLWPLVREQGGLALSWEESPADLEAYFVVLEG